MKGRERPCSIRRRLRSSQNVLQRSVAFLTQLGHHDGPILRALGRSSSKPMNDEMRESGWQLSVAWLLRHAIDCEDAKMAIPFADGAGGTVFRRMSPLHHLFDRVPSDEN